MWAIVPGAHASYNAALHWSEDSFGPSAHGLLFPIGTAVSPPQPQSPLGIWNILSSIFFFF